MRGSACHANVPPNTGYIEVHFGMGEHVYDLPPEELKAQLIVGDASFVRCCSINKLTRRPPPAALACHSDV